MYQLHKRCLVESRFRLESPRASRPVDYVTGPSLADQELRSKLGRRRSLPGRARRFPSERCLSILLSMVRSATRSFSRRFSSSRALSLFASSKFDPPYWARERASVASLVSTACSTDAGSFPECGIASTSRKSGDDLHQLVFFPLC